MSEKPSVFIEEAQVKPKVAPSTSVTSHDSQVEKSALLPKPVTASAARPPAPRWLLMSKILQVVTAAIHSKILQRITAVIQFLLALVTVIVTSAIFWFVQYRQSQLLMDNAHDIWTFLPLVEYFCIFLFLSPHLFILLLVNAAEKYYFAQQHRYRAFFTYFVGGLALWEATELMTGVVLGVMEGAVWVVCKAVEWVVGVVSGP